MEEKMIIQSYLIPDLSIENLDVPKELAEYRFDEGSVKREVEEIRLKNATIEAGEAVEAGDFIEIKVNGNSQRFPVTVGLGLLGKKTEQSFLGLRVGDTVIAMEQPFLGKEVAICAIKRRILPEFSDQMAIELGYQSVIDYQERRCEEMRSQVKRDCARTLVQQECLGKANRATLVPCGTELDDLIRDYQGINAELFRSRNMDPASIAPDELEQAFGIRTVADLDKKTADSAALNLKLAIIGQKVAMERGLAFGEAEYEQKICTLAKKYLMNEESVRKNTSFKTALVEEYVKLLFSEQIARTEAIMREVE